MTNAPTEQETAEFQKKVDALHKAAEKVKIINMHRMTAFALLECGMRFREGHWREDIDLYRANAQAKEEASDNKGKGDRGYAKRAQQRIDQLVINYQGQQERMNRLVYAEIDALVKSLTPESKNSFDNLCAMFGEMMLEFSKANSKGDLLKVCQMYNMGFLDPAIEHFKNMQEGGKNDASEPVKIPDGEQSEETTEELKNKRDNLLIALGQKDNLDAIHSLEEEKLNRLFPDTPPAPEKKEGMDWKDVFNEEPFEGKIISREKLSSPQETWPEQDNTDTEI